MDGIRRFLPACRAQAGSIHSVPSIRDVLGERGDLSTYLVHLTRGNDPYASLAAILTTANLEARQFHGLPRVRNLIEGENAETPLAATQRVVCFTETPLHFARLMCV